MKQKFIFSLSKRGVKGPTPVHIARRIDIWTVVCGAVITGVNSHPFDFVPVAAASTISWFLGIALTILQGLKPFYSVETSQKNVPIGDVGTMETQDDK